MNSIRQLARYPYLLQSYIAYLLLGITDIVHHLHVATVLDNPGGMHAVVAGAILLPLSVVMVWLLAKFNKTIFVWGIVAIAMICVLMPGLYHGGWDHLVKVLAFFRVDSEFTEISSIFPADNFNLWFYEITGILEFLIGVVAVYFLYKFLSSAIRARR